MRTGHIHVGYADGVNILGENISTMKHENNDRVWRWVSYQNKHREAYICVCISSQGVHMYSSDSHGVRYFDATLHFLRRLILTPYMHEA